MSKVVEGRLDKSQKTPSCTAHEYTTGFCHDIFASDSVGRTHKERQTDSER